MRRTDNLPALPMPGFGQVYPLSVAEGIMTGDILLPEKSRNSALLWHYCGFGYILGEPEPDFLNEILELMLSGERRLVLFSDDAAVEGFFRSREEIQTGQRLFFRYEGGVPGHDPEVCPLTHELLPLISGRVTPGIFWENSRDLLSRGKGFCIMRNGSPAAWAFSAAVSSSEADIGVETAAGHQRQGLAARTAGEMIRFALDTGRKPVWACSAENAGSRKTAEKLGFVQSGSCLTFQKKKTT